nr:type I restriction-modification system subunit M [Arsenicicoccus piscis]
MRGSVDGWDFKGYVLGMLFYRFISEHLTDYLNGMERAAGVAAFDYAELGDGDAEFGREVTVSDKGYYILPSELFVNVRRRARGDADLNETLARVFRNIEGSAVGTGSEDDLKGLFDELDVSNKLGPTVARRNEQLVKLLDAIGDLKLGTFADNTIDAFGDAYEYLMTMYASSAGKSGGEFFTPQEVSELLARITVVGKTSVNGVYDPACGSGSLLLQFAKVLGKDNVRRGFFGQEINLTTYNLARINMFLHDINYEDFDIALGDTLLDPAHGDIVPFEAIVSNPPYSTKWRGADDPTLINDPRFSPAGILAPKSMADLAFTMHILSWLAVDGTAAIVDASKQFTRIGNKIKLTEGHQQAVLDAFTAREDVPHFATLVEAEALADNVYNLSVSSYVEAEDREYPRNGVSGSIARKGRRSHDDRDNHHQQQCGGRGVGQTGDCDPKPTTTAG